MDANDMDWWLNWMMELGWELVTGGTKHWVSEEVMTQDWWVFRRERDNQNGWYKIATAPREIEYRCLLAHEKSIVTGYWDGQGWRNERSAGLGYFPATHWQPLPPLPAGE